MPLEHAIVLLGVDRYVGVVEVMFLIWFSRPKWCGWFSRGPAYGEVSRRTMS